MSTPEQQPHRSGFVALVGRPNAGKTTLTNALVGEKVGIVSNRPQTTRHAIRGVVHRPAGQIVLVDTPGLHKPKSLLGKRLNDVVRDTLSDVDVIVFCVPADQPVGAGDAFIARQLREVKAPIVVVVTKTDIASKKQVAVQLMAAQQADRERRRGGAGQRRRRRPGRPARGPADRAAAGGPAALPGGADHRRGRRAAARRAGPRGGAGEGAPGGAALPRGHDRGGDPPSRPQAAGQRLRRDPRAAARRAGQPEADAARQGRRRSSRRSAARRGSAWRRCSTPACTSSCT